MSGMLFSKERVGALTDGVIAIAATLLVLDLKLPNEGAELTFGDFQHTFHVFLGWLISMIMIATIWYEQHFLFRRTTAWDNPLLVITFMQLATVSLIPFASGLVAEYPADLATALIFSGIMLVNGLLLAANGFLLGARPHRRESGVEAMAVHRRATIQVVCYIGITALSLLGATIHHPLTGVVAWCLSPTLVALVGRDRAQHVGAAEPPDHPHKHADAPAQEV